MYANSWRYCYKDLAIPRLCLVRFSGNSIKFYYTGFTLELMLKAIDLKRLNWITAVWWTNMLNIFAMVLIDPDQVSVISDLDYKKR